MMRLAPAAGGRMERMPTRVSARISAISESATLAVDAKAKALKAAGRPAAGVYLWKRGSAQARWAASTM